MILTPSFDLATMRENLHQFIKYGIKSLAHLAYLNTLQQATAHDDSQHIVSHDDEVGETMPCSSPKVVYLSADARRWDRDSDTRNNTNENDIKTKFSSIATSVV